MGILYVAGMLQTGQRHFVTRGVWIEHLKATPAAMSVPVKVARALTMYR